MGKQILTRLAMLNLALLGSGYSYKSFIILFYMIKGIHLMCP